jgi:hypothetical protein
MEEEKEMIENKGLTDEEVQKLIDDRIEYSKNIELWKQYFFTQTIREIILKELLNTQGINN